ncbi:hypothetical protein PC119_g9313 [Phytophthora cactorum]|nr:hypothetical protein PC119_g9313 [Phytophthora cactorum]KAG3172565.1 hypothetical protein C6341_g10217 [Phytophthora cactorum]
MPSRQSPSSSHTPSHLQSRATPSAVPTGPSRREPSQQSSRASSFGARAVQVGHLRPTLAMLEDREESRCEELNQYPSDVDDNDIEVTSTELSVFWFSVRSHIVRYWDVGRGRRSTFAAKDVFFMLLVVMKCGGTWDMLSRIFKIKTPTFIKTITGFIEVVAPKLH